MIDFHSHILPNMDDGCKTIEESLKLLEMLENEEVDVVCLTPHFYPNREDINTFLLRRKKSFETLKSAYKGNIKLLLGSEVRYYRGISNNNEIDSLTLENTNIMLLELPFDEPISDFMLQEVIKLSKNQHILVVLAHIERYDIDDLMIKNLQNSGILIQANTSSFLGLFKGKKAIKRLKYGLIDIIGTDSHDPINRIPRYKQVLDLLEKKIGKNTVKSLNLRVKSLIKA